VSYLPAVINGGAFLMLMVTPHEKLVKYRQFTSAILMTTASYQSIANLASRFVSESLSKKPYYEAVCFFGCFGTYYSLAKIWDMVVRTKLKGTNANLGNIPQEPMWFSEKLDKNDTLYTRKKTTIEMASVLKCEVKKVSLEQCYKEITTFINNNNNLLEEFEKANRSLLITFNKYKDTQNLTKCNEFKALFLLQNSFYRGITNTVLACKMFARGANIENNFDVDSLNNKQKKTFIDLANIAYWTSQIISQYTQFADRSIIEQEGLDVD
jgi:hypothetical protein